MTDLQKQFQEEKGISFEDIPINGVHLEYITWLESQIQALRIHDVSGMLPTDEELDNAAIDFVNGHCDNLSGDLTQETECFDAGAVWMRERLLGNYR